MDQTDLRWHQRFVNYQRALAQLKQFIDHGPLNAMEQQGLIQAFQFTHELAWNVMKDYVEYQGNNRIMGSRDATREAFQYGLVVDGEAWMSMIKSRNQAPDAYIKDTADAITDLVVGSYFVLFQCFADRMQALADDT